MVKQAHEGERQRTHTCCPRCTRVLKVRAHVGRTVKTMVGPVELARPYFYCRACRVGLYPFDDALGLVPGCQQLDMQHAAVQLVTEVPYGLSDSNREILGVQDRPRHPPGGVILSRHALGYPSGTARRASAT